MNIRIVSAKLLQKEWGEFLESTRLKYLVNIPQQMKFFERLQFLGLTKTKHAFTDKKGQQGDLDLLFITVCYNGILKNIVILFNEDYIWEGLEGIPQYDISKNEISLKSQIKYERAFLDDALDSEIITEVLNEDFSLGDKAIRIYMKEK